MRTFAIIALLLSLLVAFPSSGVAQEISFTASVDRNTIAAGEQIRLSITLTNTQERFTAPDLGGLVVVQGPYENSSMSFVNGRMSSSITRQWIITGTQPGKYVIGPARVKVGGGVIETDPITIEVGKAAARPQDPYAGQGQRSDPNLFATITFSRNKAYVGEQVTATYTLYTRYPTVELADFDLPKLNGFWSEDIDQGQQGWEQKQETINGIVYRVAVLKRQLLFPQRSGKLRVEPMKLECVVNRSWLSQGTRIPVTSNAVEFQAIDLPTNPPAGFNGAVGDLQLSVKAERTNVKANEAVDLNVKLSGSTNLKLLAAPNLSLPPDLETYDPKVVDKISVNAGGMSGSREFQYLIIPRHEGSYELPPITFSYFDVGSGSYRTLQSEALTINVEPGDGGAAPLVQRPSRSDVQELGQDIRYLRTDDLALRKADERLYGSVRWFAGLGLPPLAFLLLVVWQRRRHRDLADVEGRRRRHADRMARKLLHEAQQALDKGQRDGFYAALSKAVHGYLADKLGLGLAEIGPNTLHERLASIPEGHAIGDRCLQLLNTCDMARFAPVEDKPRKELLAEAADIIGRIERSLRT